MSVVYYPVQTVQDIVVLYIVHAVHHNVNNMGEKMDVNSTVAANLKALREQRKLSLEAMARLTGVSKSMLGQIERGEVNPTISVLWRIANGLKISFSTLLEKPAKELHMIKAESVKPMVEGDGLFINYPAFAFEESTRFETYRIEILPGGELLSLPHLDGTQEYVTVFAGTVRIRAGETVCELKTGDSLRFRADVPHSYHNEGSEKAQLSMLIHYSR